MLEQAELDKKTFSPEVPISSILDLHSRIQAFTSLFSNAPSARAMFTLFEIGVVKDVSFGTLSAERIDNTSSYKLNVNGSAKDYEDLALQRDTFASEPFSQFISNVSIDSRKRNEERGTVEFQLSMTAKVDRFGYANVFTALSGVNTTPPSSQKPIEPFQQSGNPEPQRTPTIVSNEESIESIEERTLVEEQVIAE